MGTKTFADNRQGMAAALLWILEGTAAQPRETEVRTPSFPKWLRVSQIPELYHISKSYAAQLVRDMREQGSPEDFIFDGKVKLIRAEALEDFWRKRGAE